MVSTEALEIIRQAAIRAGWTPEVCTVNKKRDVCTVAGPDGGAAGMFHQAALVEQFRADGSKYRKWVFLDLGEREAHPLPLALEHYTAAFETVKAAANKERALNRRRAAARARHQAMLDCGLVRGRDSLGRVIYE